MHFNKHIDIIISKAYKLYNFVKRSDLELRKCFTFIYLHKSLIRPQLEYAVAIWNPLYENAVKLRRNLKSVKKCLNEGKFVLNIV